MTAYNEIYTYNDDTTDLFNGLTPQERIFTYYMFRASLPFNKIYRDQNHRHTNEIIKAFEFLHDNGKDIDQNLLEDVKTFLVYLWSNHGPYFMTEHSNNKRTPSKLNMKYLTQESFMEALTNLNYPYTYNHILPTIFDENVDREMVVDGNIEESGNNYYQKGFTEEHYNMLPSEHKNKINAYFELDKGKPVMKPYAINHKYSDELNIAIFWLEKAIIHVINYPENFDGFIVESLKLLVKYFETGDEEYFKQHSIQWLQTNSNLDYTMGFIETYHDPKSIRGHAGAEITIKMANMEKVNPVLLEFEQRIPIKDEYKKKHDKNNIMNVSPNRILFGSGDYGPQTITAAYCLPNYDDIRAQYGSKQILYKLPKSLGEKLNPEMTKQFRTVGKQTFIEKYDKDNDIGEDLWDVQVLLHETVGHGSGALHEHVFKEGENLIVGGIEYKVGDVLQMTDANYADFIKEDSASLEELRAEINALYMSIAEIDKLTEMGLYKNWLNILGRDELIKQNIINMCSTGFRRLLSQSPEMTDIKGAHARANIVIMNYLIDGGGIRINEEIRRIDDDDYVLLEIEVLDVAKSWANIVELVQLVQKIKSTGDTLECGNLFGKYTVYPMTIDKAKEYRCHLMNARKKLVGNIKATVKVFPKFVLVTDNNNVIDVKVETLDIFEQNKFQEKLTLSYDY